MFQPLVLFLSSLNLINWRLRKCKGGFFMFCFYQGNSVLQVFVLDLRKWVFMLWRNSSSYLRFLCASRRNDAVNRRPTSTTDRRPSLTLLAPPTCAVSGDVQAHPISFNDDFVYWHFMRAVIDITHDRLKCDFDRINPMITLLFLVRTRL